MELYGIIKQINKFKKKTIISPNVNFIYFVFYVNWNIPEYENIFSFQLAYFIKHYNF